MRLHEFILANREPILVEWEAFARTATPASDSMDAEALRDHANRMLSMIAANLQTSQTDLEQSEKSKGNAPDAGIEETAAETHGAERASSGFTVEQTMAEFRALRASVLRLWTEEAGRLEASDLADLTRFNEAIDQLIAESLSEYFDKVDSAKEILIGILGHDLRTPLGGIQTATRFMVDYGGMEEPYPGLTSRINSLAEYALQLVGDLLDFTRGRLAGGIPIERDVVDLVSVVRSVVDEMLAGHPQRTIHMNSGHVLIGRWDRARIRQALTNLVGNAFEHGDQETAVTISFQEDEDDVAVCIHNHGPPIPPELLRSIFDPWKGIESRRSGSHLGPTGNLGLGLYIAERIVHAHGGRLEVESSEETGTVFTVHLPGGV